MILQYLEYNPKKMFHQKHKGTYRMKNSKPIEGHLSNQRQLKKMQTSECEHGSQDIMKRIAK